MQHIIIPLFCLLLLGCVSTSRNAENLVNTTDTVSQSSIHLATYSGDVNTTGWNIYRSTALGFEVQYPDSFVVTESGSTAVTIKRPSDTTGDQIVFTSVRSTLAKEVSSVIYSASSIDRVGLYMRDVGIRYAIAFFHSGDAHSWFMTYFLMRNADYPTFPHFTENRPYTVVRADIEAFPSDEEFQRMLQQSPDRVGPQIFLSEPQQILSTFRFIPLPL
jgi:hypothetical protein